MAADGLSQQWVKTYDGKNGDGGANVAFDEAKAITVDSAGNVYITGASTQTTGCPGFPAPPDCGLDFATIKYNSAGIQQWVARYNNVNGGSDSPVAMIVDVGGNVYVTGKSNQFAEGPGANYDFATVKYNNSGNQQWVARYNSGSEDVPVAIAVDNDGNVFVTGRKGGTSSSSYDFATIKYDSSGNVAWTKIYDGGGRDEAVALVLDAVGNPVITGRTRVGSSDAVYIAKYDSATGNVLWSQTYSSGAGTSNYPVAMGLDGSGNIYIAGDKLSGTGNDFLVLKYSDAGPLQWANTYDRGNDRATAMALDGGGDLYVAGSSIPDGGTYDYALVKFRGSDGVQQWAKTYDNGNFGYSAAVAVDNANGYVYMAGSGMADSGTYDYAIAMYDGSGNPVHLVAYDSGYEDIARAITVDTTGAVVVTGGNFYDFATVKYVLADVSADQPDLTVSSLALASPQVAVNQPVTLNYKVKNQGLGSAGLFNMDVYLVDAVLGSDAAFFDDFNATLFPWTQQAGGTVNVVDSLTDGWVMSKTAGADPGGTAAPLASAVNDFDLRLYTKRTGWSDALSNSYSVTDSDGNGYDVTLNYDSGQLELNRRDGWTVTTLNSTMLNGAVKLDGIDGKVVIADPTQLAALNPTSTLTYSIEFWFLPEDWSSDMAVIQKENEFTAYRSGSKLAFLVAGASRITTADIVPGNWYHVVFVRNSNKFLLYLNAGSPDGSSTTVSGVSASSNNKPIELGHRIPNDLFFKGRIEQLAFYNVALSASDILNHYNGGVGKDLTGTTGLQAYWKMDQISGDAIDSVGGHNGTLSNGASWAGGLHQNTWHTLHLRHQGSGLTANVYDGKADPDTATPRETLTATDTTHAGFTQVNAAGGYPYYSDAVEVTGLNSVDVSSQGIYLGSTPINGMLPSELVTTNTSVVIQPDVTPGRYNLALIADGDNTITESDEDNNLAMASAVTLLPDLVVTAMSGVPAAALPGDSLNVDVSVKNSRAQPTEDSFLVRVYLSADNTITTADTLLGSRTISGLDGNTTDSGTIAVMLPNTEDLFYLGAIVDPAGDVVESNEANNTFVTDAIIISTQPDLEATAVVTTTPSPTAGSGITVDTTITNQSAVAAGIFDFQIYLSTDPTWDAGDTLLDTVSVSGGLGGLAADNQSTSVTLPFVDSGNYYLILKADTAGAVSEFDEGNNSVASAVVAVNEAVLLPTDNYLTLAGTAYLNVPHSTSLNRSGGAWTIEAWVRIADYAGDKVIVSKRTDSDDTSYLFYINSSGKLAFGQTCYLYYSDDIPQYTVDVSTSAVPTGEWVHVAVTSDDDSAYYGSSAFIRFYINGAAAGAIFDDCNSYAFDGFSEYDFFVTNSQPVRIGSNGPPGNYFQGDLDDVRIWNVTRTQAQIQASKDAQIAASSSGLIGYWKLNEGAGVTAFDSTVNHNDGTLTNDPTWVVSIAITGGNNSTSGGGGGAIDMMDLVLLFVFGAGMLATTGARRAGYGRSALNWILIVGITFTPMPGWSAFTFNFQSVPGSTPIEYLGNPDDGGCDWNGPCTSYTDVYEMVTGSDGKSYWHYVITDPAQGFAQEVYIKSVTGPTGYNLFDAGGALADVDGNGTTLGNADNPLGSNMTITGNGTGNPRSVAMRMILTEPANDAGVDLGYEYSFYYDFYKPDTDRKPLIEMQLNPASDNNSEIKLHFVADMRGVSYGDMSTDLSGDPFHSTNTLIMIDPALQGSAGFDAVNNAQDALMTGGRYTFTPGTGWTGTNYAPGAAPYVPGTYHYYEGTGFDLNADWNIFKN